jgi:two-component system phosphate regulon sensor histidine kinase PhoR
MGLSQIGFAKRLLAVYGIVFITVLLITDWSLSRVFEKRDLEQLENSLVRQSALTSHIALPMLQSGPELQTRVKELSRGTDARITVIDPAGKVLADSDETPADLPKMDNHLTRPEVADALKLGTGKSIRYSLTLKTKMLYVAVPILDGRELKGIVRTAMPVTRVDAILAATHKPLVLLALAAILVVLAAGILFASQLTNRIRKITSVAERYAREDWSEKVLISGKDELKLLADTMNHMASTLQHRIRDLEGEKGKITAILLNMTEAVIAIDRHKDVVMANPTAETLFGFSTDTVKGKSLIQTTRHPYLESLVDRAFAARQTLADEIQLAGKAKKTLRVSVVVTEEHVRDIGGILVFHDITEIRRLENIRREFVSNASHELRTPLTSIKGFIETLLGGASKDPAASEKFLKIMQEDATRLSRLVEDMLTLSEIEQGAVPLKKEALDLVPEVRAIAERFTPQCGSKNIVIEDRLPKSPLPISGDRDKVRQVFVNLIDNAVKFNKAGGRIVLSAERTKDGVRVTIEDTGSGIPEDSAGRVFERFFRADKVRSRELGGTGLGLAIVKHIMESHNGRVTCESQPGKGSAFSVFFPA